MLSASISFPTNISRPGDSGLFAIVGGVRKRENALESTAHRQHRGPEAAASRVARDERLRGVGRKRGQDTSGGKASLEAARD